MGDVLMHSQSSAKKFGGTPDDYVPIHKFLDQSKLFIADWRHRALLHTTFGISLAEQMFGDLYKRPSDGVAVSTRTIASQHITEDLGCIPTPEVFLREMPIRPWMNGFNKAQIREMQGMTMEAPPNDEFPSHTADCTIRQGNRVCSCGFVHPWGVGKPLCDICGKDCDGHVGEGWG